MKTLLLVSAMAARAAATWHFFDGFNAVNGCGNVCNTNGPYTCIGTFSTVEDCESKCTSTAGCSILTWSSHSGNCWMRTDGQWIPDAADGDTAGCDDSRIPACKPPPPPYVGNITVTVDTATVLGKTHPLSPAIALDFWRSDDPTFGEKWGNSSALHIDLSDPQLIAMTAALAPALLRLGGSPEDSLIYDSDGTCVPQSGGAGPAPGGYYCSQVRPYSYDCIEPQRWQDLLAFAHATGVQIIFGLNGCYGRMSSNSSMDFSNIAAMMKDTASSPHVSAFYGWELSNEVMPNTISPYIYGKDMGTLHDMAASIFQAAGAPIPRVAGPDQGGSSPIASIAVTTPPATLTDMAFTYHQYVQCEAPQPANGYVMSPPCLQNVDTQAQQCVTAAALAPVSPAPPVWAGETADHSGGGIANLTDTFRSSFYYAWQLGALAANGVELAARQTLSGGDYELLQRVGFAPNPDYWVIWLFRKLIGGGASAYSVVHSVPTNQSGVRLFAFSAASATGAKVTLLALNLQNPGAPTIYLNLQGTGVGGLPRTEYHLTGDVTVPHGPVSCNGQVLAPQPGTYAPPAWQSLGVTANGPLALPPATIVFATIA